MTHSDATRLGAALMEQPTLTTTMTLRGTVFGQTAQEIAEKARDDAASFFNDIPFTLDVSVERSDVGLLFIGTYWARA